MTRLVAVAILLVFAGCRGGGTHLGFPRDEVVIGRARLDGVVWLLTDQHRLYRFLPRQLQGEWLALRGIDADVAWGLAVGSDGRLWTLVNGTTLTEVRADGELGERVALGRRFLGLFGGRLHGLLLQPARLAPGLPLLERREPRTQPVGPAAGSLRGVTYPTRVEGWARNLVACGSTAGDEMPCWLNGHAEVDRIRPNGDSRRLTLDLPDSGGVRTGSVFDVETVGPIIDVHITATDDLWVLLSGSMMPDREDHHLVRYASDGTWRGGHRLDRRGRLILDVLGDTGLVLEETGEVVEIRPQ